MNRFPHNESTAILVPQNLLWNSSNKTGGIPLESANTYKVTSFRREIPCAFPLVPEYDYVTLSMGILIIVLNVFVFTLFSTQKRLRRLSGNFVLASLSINDLLNGCYMLYNLFPQFYLHNNNCQVSEYSRFNTVVICQGYNLS